MSKKVLNIGIDYSSFQNLCIMQKRQALSLVITILSDFITHQSSTVHKKKPCCALTGPQIALELATHYALRFLATQKNIVH